MKGAGVLHYRSVDGVFNVESLHTTGEVSEAEDLLRKGLDGGKIDPKFCYLTNWNNDTKQVELVIGEFPELGDFSWYA
jgi:hypothetical protein